MRLAHIDSQEMPRIDHFRCQSTVHHNSEIEDVVHKIKMGCLNVEMHLKYGVIVDTHETERKF